MENKGSEWRKWDLHLHTPQTKLNDNFKSEEDIWKLFCEKIENSDVSVFGITDYFSVDNYFIFINKHKEHYPNSTKVFFPNIEFRLEVSVNKQAEEVNIHVIFSNKVSESKINEFLMKLNTNITKSTVKVSCKNLTGFKDYESAGVDYNKIREKLFEVFGRENCYLLIAAANNAGLRADTKSPRKLILSDEIDKISDAFYGGTQNVLWYQKNDRYENKEIAKSKPVVCGCDAHSFQDMDSFLGKRYLGGYNGQQIIKDITWIKAEPIFEGLLQILNEPSRVFIGITPPVLKRVSTNPTKFIKSLEISKNPDSILNDLWFNNFEVALNPELVAIIGNKGKGKSALSDILGLCANAHIEEADFSFLNKSKFRNPRPNIAKEFTAILKWEGGKPDTTNLDSIPKLGSPERVKYIPQSFLEKLCTSIDKKVFEAELEKVIFSRLEDHQKLGKGTLQEVLNEKKLALENEIVRIKNEISILNISIIEQERKNSTGYRKSIDDSIQFKENELNVHEANKPNEIIPPNQSDETIFKAAEITEKITNYRENIKNIQQQKAELTSERSKLTVDVNELLLIIQNFNALSSQINTVVQNHETAFNKYGLNANAIISFTINSKPVLDLINVKLARLKVIDLIFEEGSNLNPDILVGQQEGLIKELSDELEGENKAYQEYLSRHQEWLNIKQQILGDIDKEGTITYLKEVKNFLVTKIHVVLEQLYSKRKIILIELLTVKTSIAELYKVLYKPVSEFISQNKNELSDYNVNIDVALGLNGFEEKFFNYISNGSAGSFYGGSESRQMLSKITDIVNFDQIDEVANWIETIIQYLKSDKRDGQNPLNKKELNSQLKGGFNEKDLYDFLFSLDYYEPNYQLKLGSKNLSELSPGERGALLLIFYLLLDKQDIPIIIDQPEENLDNQSVYKILVHFIKKAKERRQIIIVTHNPNLAVVCDAEQIIKMDIAKDSKNLVSMVTGGIEALNINRAIVDILEGTRPAFNNRTDKYEVTNKL